VVLSLPQHQWATITAKLLLIVHASFNYQARLLVDWMCLLHRAHAVGSSAVDVCSGHTGMRP
jgi:hypothetical protein